MRWEIRGLEGAEKNMETHSGNVDKTAAKMPFTPGRPPVYQDANVRGWSMCSGSIAIIEGEEGPRQEDCQAVNFVATSGANVRVIADSSGVVKL